MIDGLLLYDVHHAPAPKVWTFTSILRSVAERHNLTVEQLLSPARARVYSRPRQEVMWLAKQHTKLSYPAIGQRMGGRDHTTIIHGVREHDKRLKTWGLVP